MAKIEQNQAALCKVMNTMGDRMNQLMETLDAVIQGQEEIRLSVTMLVDSASTSENDGPRNDNGGIPKENPRLILDDHHNVIDLDDPPKDSTADLSGTAKMYKALEERLKAMENSKNPGFSVVAMCLVLGVVIPPKFKVPEFDN